MKLRDVHGQSFGSWKVEGRAESRNGVTYWLCRCECGRLREVSLSSLNSGNSSCRQCYVDRHRGVEIVPGTAFGRWTVIGPDQSRNGRVWVCQCACGLKKAVSAKALVSAASTQCKACSRASLHVKVGDVPVRYYTQIISSSYARGLPFTLSIEYLADLFCRQGGRCACTGLPLVFAPQSRKRDTTASLDRLDNAAGYCEGNVRWVHKVVNRMRGVLGVDEFVTWCGLVVQHCV